MSLHTALVKIEEAKNFLRKSKKNLFLLIKMEPSLFLLEE